MSEQPKRRSDPTGKLARDPAEALQAHQPWKPVEVPPEVAGALQGLYRGDAADHQQRLALGWILEMCHNGGAHYFPGEGGRRDTDFALGRAFVGLQLKRIIQLKVTRGGEHG